MSIIKLESLTVKFMPHLGRDETLRSRRRTNAAGGRRRGREGGRAGVRIFAILAGGEIHGITGMLIAIPLIPLVKETIVFLRPRTQFEGWGAAAGGAIDSVVRDEPAENPATACSLPPGPGRLARWNMRRDRQGSRAIRATWQHVPSSLPKRSETPYTCRD